MLSKLYWIEGPWKGKLAITPRPRGYEWIEDEILFWKDSDLEVIVSLLTREEMVTLGLEEEENFCSKYGLEFLSFPIVDRDVPESMLKTLNLVKELYAKLSNGKKIAIHCRQGIGRAALIASALLVFSGVDPEKSFVAVSRARGCSVPETSGQKDWIKRFAENFIPLTMT